MTDRTYRTLLGLALLVSLYFDLPWLMYSIIGVLFAEGVTNQRLPKLVCMIRKCVTHNDIEYINLELEAHPRFELESERMWRLVVGFFLLLSYSYIDALWFFPWFMGFAIFGAGLSGVCPVLLGIRWVGFK